MLAESTLGLEKMAEWESYTPARLHAKILGFKYIAVDEDGTMCAFMVVPHITRFNLHLLGRDREVKNTKGGWWMGTKYNYMERKHIGIYIGKGKWRNSVRKV